MSSQPLTPRERLKISRLTISRYTDDGQSTIDFLLSYGILSASEQILDERYVIIDVSNVVVEMSEMVFSPEHSQEVFYVMSGGKPVLIQYFDCESVGEDPNETNSRLGMNISIMETPKAELLAF